MKLTSLATSTKNGLLWRVSAALTALLVIWLIWDGWRFHSASQLIEKTALVRQEAAERVRQHVNQPLVLLEKLKNQAPLITALKRQDTNAATQWVSRSLPGSEAVQIMAPDMEAAYADPAAFGYGKLGLIERALQQQRATVAVVKDAGAPRLSFAVPVEDQGQVLGVVYTRFPLAPLQAVVTSVPSGGYLALRQDHYTIAEIGNKDELQFKAEVDAIEIKGTSLRVVAVAPIIVPGLFGSLGWGQWVVALLLGVLAAGLWWWPSRHAKLDDSTVADGVVDKGLTLAEMQSAGTLTAGVLTEAPKAVRVKVESETESELAEKTSLDRSIFRAYDIRGVVGKTLDSDIARLIGEAIGTAMADAGQRSIVVGRDGRLSSPSMAAALIEGLRRTGRDVIDIGLAPTPLVYFGTYHARTGCGVAVTGSHNPPDYNGFKIVIDGETLSGDAIQGLYLRIAENRLLRAETLGQLTQRDLKADYLARISGDIQLKRKLKVVIDCGSGVAGGLAPELLEAIGADVEPLFCEVDGTFPHHHPDPSDPANLRDLIQAVQRVGADIGLALDGDGDRLGAVTQSGEIIYPDRLLMLFAEDVLERNPGACIIYDVKCTGQLATHILRHGGSPLMWKTGHSLIKSKMRETEAELAGEMSGHFFFRERWYGFDDGLYAAARLLEILAARSEDGDAVFATLPKGISTPELKIELAEGEQYRFVEKFLTQAKFESARISTIDGLRADWPDGWGLVRASNTTPVLVLRFDAKDETSLSRIQSLFREQMMKVDPNLQLPF